MGAQLVRLVALDAADPAIENRLTDAAKTWLAGDKQALDHTEMPNAFTAYVASGGFRRGQGRYERAVPGDMG